jgi:hypothetical protein
MRATEHDGAGADCTTTPTRTGSYDQIVIRVPQPNSPIDWTAAHVDPIQLMCSPFNLYTCGFRRSLGVYA